MVTRRKFMPSNSLGLALPLAGAPDRANERNLRRAMDRFPRSFTSRREIRTGPSARRARWIIRAVWDLQSAQSIYAGLAIPSLRLPAAGSAFYRGDKNMQEDYLPDPVGLLAPRRCWLLNASNAEGEMGLLVHTD